MNKTERRKILATIDMTPLMDLTFMLLIIFVITVPSMYYKTDVKLTPPESTTNDQMEVEDKSVFVELDRDGGIWIGRGNNKHSKSLPSTEDLTRELIQLRTVLPDMIVYLVGDQERQYKDVVKIANAVQKAKIGSISLVFTPEKKDNSK